MKDLTLFNSLFDDFGFGGYSYPAVHVKTAYQTPKVDVREEKDSYILEMDLPGKTDKDVNVELNKNVLTISSVPEEKPAVKQENTESPKWLIRERTPVSFSRSFTIPDDVNTDELSALCRNGILEIKMPRKAQTTPRKITISRA